MHPGNKNVVQRFTTLSPRINLVLVMTSLRKTTTPAHDDKQKKIQNIEH